MGSWGSAFNLIAWFYLGIAALTVWRLVRAGRATFDDELTAGDWRLVGEAAFYLVTPAAVVLHELGHAAVVWAFQGRIVAWHFLFYWGYVVPSRSFGAYGDLAVALAGNLVTLALGLLAGWRVFGRPANAAWNFFWWRFAEIQLSMVLVFYPLLCLFGFGGDFKAIYRLSTAWVSGPLLALHLGLLLLLWRGWRGRLGARARMLTGPLWDEVRGAKAVLGVKPDDCGARMQLAWAYLAVGLRREARPWAEAVLALRPELPAAHALLGQALVEEDPERATRELQQALGAPALDPLLCATSHLSLARLALNRAQGALALPHACAALEGLPCDVTAARLVWDAAEATGPCADALGALDRAAARGNAVARQGLEALERLARRGAVG